MYDIGDHRVVLLLGSSTRLYYMGDHILMSYRESYYNILSLERTKYGIREQRVVYPHCTLISQISFRDQFVSLGFSPIVALCIDKRRTSEHSGEARLLLSVC